MNIDDYQARAAETFQFDLESTEAISICLLGIAGEVGELSTEYKKKIRDGNSYKIFKDKITEELGDIMWYLSSIATYEDIQLSDILQSSLQKIQERWHDLKHPNQLGFEGELFDDGLSEDEQFPREFVAEFMEVKDESGKVFSRATINGVVFGSELRDNAYNDDYYRFHDIFHLSYTVVLGWSPVVRKFMGKKRRSDEKTDEIEDGGRASVIDEALSILIFEYARDHSFLVGAGGVDYQLLRTVKMLTRHLEVKSCTPKQWEEAILLGFEMWHKLCAAKSGRIVCNLQDKTMIFEPVEADSN